jgi:hypothetical protein
MCGCKWITPCTAPVRTQGASSVLTKQKPRKQDVESSTELLSASFVQNWVCTLSWHTLLGGDVHESSASAPLLHPAVRGGAAHEWWWGGQQAHAGTACGEERVETQNPQRRPREDGTERGARPTPHRTCTKDAGACACHPWLPSEFSLAVQVGAEPTKASTSTNEGS